MSQISIAIVEDVEDYRKTLEIIFNGTADFRCIKSFANTESAIRELPILLPDVVLTDIHLPRQSGIDVILQLKSLCPSIQFMMLTVYEDDDKIFKALEAGATGYLLKSTPLSKILEAVKELHEGGSPMSAQIARKVVDRFNVGKNISDNPYKNLLTPREKELLDLLRKGLLYKHIADTLFIAETTVKSHCRHIYEKLHVTTRGEAVYEYYGKKDE